MANERDKAAMANYRVSLLLIALTTAGCDRISGLRTEADLPNPANIDCINQTLRNIPGIGKISYRRDQSESFQVVPYRGKVISVSHQWSYGPSERASVQILEDGSKRTYFNGMQKMGEPYPSLELDRFEPLMVRVNMALEAQCGLPISRGGRTSRN